MAKPFFGSYASSIIEAKATVLFLFCFAHLFHTSPHSLNWALDFVFDDCILVFVFVEYLFHISPDCLHRHRDEADDGVRDGQVEHQVVHIGPAW